MNVFCAVQNLPMTCDNCSQLRLVCPSVKDSSITKIIIIGICMITDTSVPVTYQYKHYQVCYSIYHKVVYVVEIHVNFFCTTRSTVPVLTVINDDPLLQESTVALLFWLRKAESAEDSSRIPKEEASTSPLYGHYLVYGF